MEKKKKVIVIGGGFSGLAAAAISAQNGYSVELYEKNEELGGRARVLSENEFTFDMGPSWYMMPEVFERFYGYFGKRSSDFYELVRLDPHYRVYFEHNAHVEVSDTFNAVVSSFESIEKGAGSRLHQYMRSLEKAYALAGEFIYLDVLKPRNWIAPRRMAQLLHLASLFNPFRSWDALVSRYFTDHRLKKILEFTSLFIGGSPYNTPALYSMLAYADLKGGVWYPLGGMRKVVEALEVIAREQGVSIHTGKPVTSIAVKDGVVSGVMVDGRMESADAVIGAMDLPHLEMSLLEERYRTFPAYYWEKRTMGISSLLLYIGLNKRLKNIRHHMLYFTEDWKQNFETIFNSADLPQEASFYVSARTVTDDTIAPEGCEELFVLVPIGSQFYSDEQLTRLGERVMKRLEACVGESIEDAIVYKKMYGPKDFAEDYFAFSGTALGLAQTLKQSLFMRPGSASKKVQGLFYAGQYTNPGIGVPMAIVSGELAARRAHELLN